MRFRFNALVKPVDPVVAAHASSRDADAAVAALRRAGFGGRMLSVVGQTGASVDLAGLARSPSRGAPHWAASGAGLGLLWALFTAIVVVLHPSGGAAFVALVTMGVLTLALQAAVMACVVTPERGLPRHREPGTLPASATNDGSSWRFLVVVHGSRSDVALARDILAAR
jgi:hypothetical protein